jgi:group I intron endonuclease
MDHINGRESNIILQRALKKYGIANFEFIVVEFVEDTSLLTTREQVHLDWLFSLSSEFRYNICPTAGSWLGCTHTAEAKAKMSKAHIGKC